MSLSEMLLPEFDQEMASTRKTLERVPEDRLEYKPHEKSTSLGSLAGHVAEIPSWTTVTILQDELDFAPAGAAPWQPYVPSSTAELLEKFDGFVKEARAALAGCSDEEFGKPWKLLSGGHEIFTLPKAVVIRSFVLSHMIHHRAQLGVYLRLNDVPLPSIYGPSADEGNM